MDLHLQGSVAIITGASGGIGSAIARTLADEGAALVLVGRNAGRLDEVAERLDVPTTTVVADMANPEAAQRITRHTVDRHGRIDVLINSAGAAVTGSPWDLEDDAWRDAYEVKVLGTLRMMRAVLPVMRAQRHGRVLTIVGETGRQPRPTMLPGASANAALLTLTKGFADEVARDGVTVNALNPGPTRTARIERIAREMADRVGISVAEALDHFVAGTADGRLGEPDEVARLAVVLVSDVAAHVTGIALTVDGGLTRAAP